MRLRSAVVVLAVVLTAGCSNADEPPATKVDQPVILESDSARKDLACTLAVAAADVTIAKLGQSVQDYSEVMGKAGTATLTELQAAADSALAGFKDAAESKTAYEKQRMECAGY